MRLFIGLPLSADAAQDTARIAASIRTVIPGRYTLKSNYHMTLAFLCEVPQERLDAAKQVVCAFAARFPAPRIVLGDLSCFKQPSNAILIRKAHSPDDLAAMHAALVSLLDQSGLPHADGPFSPHVTLARHADLTGAGKDALCAPPVSFWAQQAALYLSARDEQNVLRYTPLLHAGFSKP